MRTKKQFNAILCVEEVFFYFNLLNLHQAIIFLDNVVNNNLSYIGSKLEFDHLCKMLMFCYLPGVPKKMFISELFALLANEHFFWDTL